MVQFIAIENVYYSRGRAENSVTFTAGHHGLIQTFTATFFMQSNIALLDFDSIKTGGSYVVLAPQQRADMAIQASTALTIYLNR